MHIIFYILIGLFALLGLGALNTAVQNKFRHIGILFGGIIYLGGAIFAYKLESWWPFLISFVLAWIIRFLGGDPGK